MNEEIVNNEEFFLELDRIPVFIGHKGSEKKILEEKFECKIYVDSKTGKVTVESENTVNIFVLGNVIAAINLGHNPQNAIGLEDENYVLDLIDVKTLVKHDRLKSVLGRIIGREGATRKAIEEITRCSISVKDSFVSVIGPYENTFLVHEALDMLIKGASHKSFYSYLERNKISNSQF